MKLFVWSLLAFNIIDFCATAYALTFLVAKEYNPVVTFLYGFHPVAWLAVKLVLWTVGAMTLLSNPTDEWHKRVFVTVTALYGLLALYQTAVLTGVLLHGS